MNHAQTPVRDRLADQLTKGGVYLKHKAQSVKSLL